jgi:hypothetical protein
MPTPGSIERRIAQEETVLLRRTGAADLTVHAKVRGFSAQELIGDVQQGDRQVIISNKEIRENTWPGPPMRGDRVTIRGKVTTVQSCETRELRGTPVLHFIQVRGG